MMPSRELVFKSVQALLCSPWVNRLAGALLVGLNFWRLLAVVPSRSLPNVVSMMTGFVVISLFALWRRVPHAVSLHPHHWAATFVGTGLGVSSSVVAWSDGVQVLPSWAIAGGLVFSGLWSMAARLSLGRCFGLLPANRGVVTHGTYRVMRHPIYAAFVLAELIMLAGRFSLPLLAMTLLLTMTICVRLVQEEKFLADDPSYRAYQQTVRYRLMPGVW